jgi:hypothetical protein
MIGTIARLGAHDLERITETRRSPGRGNPGLLRCPWRMIGRRPRATAGTARGPGLSVAVEPVPSPRPQRDAVSMPRKSHKTTGPRGEELT